MTDNEKIEIFDIIEKKKPYLIDRISKQLSNKVEIKTPTMLSKKEDIISYLDSFNIDFDFDMNKEKLIALLPKE